MKIPHAWNGHEWTCLSCHETHPDPCSCRCCGLQTCKYGDMRRDRYGLISDRAYLELDVPVRRTRRG